VICRQKSGTQGLRIRNLGGTTIYETLGTESITLKKIDDRTVSLQKSMNGEFIDSGKQPSYCGEDAQRMHVQQKAAKYAGGILYRSPIAQQVEAAPAKPGPVNGCDHPIRKFD
jgi:hypothetical protein